MLKVLGSLMLFCGCAGIGLLQINHMDKRIRTLRSLLHGLEAAERELAFRMPLLEEILDAAARSSEDPVKRFFVLCRDELSREQHDLFCEIWNRSANVQLVALKKSDLAHLAALGSVLGRYDAEGQRQAIIRAHTALEHILSTAMTERSGQGKVYGALGTTAGAFLVILLL